MRYEVRHYVTVARDVVVEAEDPEEAFEAVRDALGAGCLHWPELDKLPAPEQVCSRHPSMEVGSWEFAELDDDWSTTEYDEPGPVGTMAPIA